MPAREMMDEGLLLQKAGVLDRAMEQYSAAFAAAEDPGTRAEALRRQAHVHRIRCEWDAAVLAAQRSASIAQAAGLDDLNAEALNAEAAVYQSRGDLDRAASLYERILEVTSNARVRGVALQNLGGVRATQGDLAGGEKSFHQAYDCFVLADYAWGQAHILNNLGWLALLSGRPDQAGELLQRGIEAAKEVNDLDLLAVTRFNYADALLARGEYGPAEAAASAALGHFTITGNHWRRIECLRVLGDLRLRMDDAEVAERFYTAALRIADEIGAQAEREQLVELLARTKA